MIKKLILWILIVFCMGTIFFLSSQEASESKKVSSGLIKTIVRAVDFNDNLSEEELNNIVENLTFIVRKGAHFSAYAVICILWSLLFSEYNIFGKRNLLFSFLICFLYACSDEIHQTFVPGRSGELRDVLIDSCGAVTGYLFLGLISKIKSKISRNKDIYT